MIHNLEEAPDRLTFAQAQWTFPEGVTFLNHGSFGPTPRSVLEVRERLLREQASNPMDFFLRKLEPLLEDAAEQMGRLVGCSGDNLIFVPNATAGMNIVAENVALAAGDEVLLTDHEYGAVVRIWGQACQQVGAKTVLARLPLPLDSKEELLDSLFEKVTPRTRLLVVSHITSPTAILFPVREICERARQQGLMVAIDGPHALGMVEIDLNSIPCDFYAVSGHKWLSGPYGSGFLYVRSRHKQGLRPNVISWGRSVAGRAPSWKDEFHWPGTFDPTPYLALPAALDLLKQYGLPRFRAETHTLCRLARQQLLTIPGSAALSTDSMDWYGSMVTVELPVRDDRTNLVQSHPLQKWLWEQHQIEVPIVRWREKTHIRTSCHLYNRISQYEKLVAAVQEWIERDQKSPSIADEKCL